MLTTSGIRVQAFIGAQPKFHNYFKTPTQNFFFPMAVLAVQDHIQLFQRGRSHSVGQIPDLLAPHTSGPRDVPRCGALSLLQKDAALQGGSSRNRCRLNFKMCTSVTACVFFYPMLKNKKHAYDMLMNLLQEPTMNLAPTTCG
jgi:hypothetical protein